MVMVRDDNRLSPLSPRLTVGASGSTLNKSSEFCQREQYDFNFSYGLEAIDE